MNKILNNNNIEQNRESQNITLKNRTELEITGVNKIESLNSEEFIIVTLLGNMIIRGTELEMKHLDIERGILWIEGKIFAMEYLDSYKPKKEKGIMGKLFK